MKRLLSAILLFLPCYAFAGISIKAEFSQTTNLIYQLDCVATNHLHCSKQTFEKLWHSEFLKSEIDRAMLKEWANLKESYSTEYNINSSNEAKPDEDKVSISILSKLSIAALQAQSTKDYSARLDLIVRPSDRARFEKIVKHFEPTFRMWWNNVARDHGTRFKKELQVILDQEAIKQKLTSFANFYESQIPDDLVIPISLIYRPDSEEPNTGLQVERYSITEFLPHEKARERVDVTVHELCHVLYANTPTDKFIKMRLKFKNRPDLAARPALSLMNETLASVLGNGLINKSLMKAQDWQKFFDRPLSLYNNPDIDSAAKATLPLIEQWIKKNKTLFHEEFVETYLSALKTKLNGELTRPKMLMNEIVVIADNHFEGRFKDLIKSNFKPNSLYYSQGSWDDPRTSSSYAAHTDFAALIIIHRKNISQLKVAKILSEENLALVTKSSEKNKSSVFSFTQKNNAPIYVIVSSNFDDASQSIKQLAEVKTGFTGELNPNP